MMHGGAAALARQAEAAETAATWNEGLDALIRFARLATGADVLLAFEAGVDGMAKPLAASPETEFMPFDVLTSRLHRTDWSSGPKSAEALPLPGTILTALARPAREVWFLPAPIPDSPYGGMLFLWLSDPAPTCECDFRRGVREHVGLLAPVFAQMLNDRSAMLRRLHAARRFEDLFGSVPNGVVIIEGHGQTGLINEQMANLFGMTAGEKTVAEISMAMRRLRERCVNSVFLGELYRPMQRNLDRNVGAVWDLGGVKLEVDTHPILGSGRNGRIWLFHDVTAQHIVDENLRQMALTDPLTGLSNRRAFFATGETMLSAAPGPEPVAALMLDIDHFKSVNDRHGHSAGDDVLREVSIRLKAVLRNEDMLARLGGEEFAIMLGGLSAAAVIDVAERLRLAVAAAPVKTADYEIEVRVSIGVAQRRGDENLAQLLQRADKALYAAKAGGRNQMISDLAGEQQSGLLLGAPEAATNRMN